MLRHILQPGDPPPCQRLNDGTGVYVVLGSPFVPFPLYTFICPGHRPLFYKRTGPLPLATLVQLQPELDEPSRAMILNVLLALRRQRVHAFQFDRASADTLFFQPVGVERLAELAKLPIPPGLAPQQMGPDEAYLLRRPVTRAGPRPCGRFPDGTGLYVIIGNPAGAHPRYACPRLPPR
jgi:hypothetical protein